MVFFAASKAPAQYGEMMLEEVRAVAATRLSVDEYLSDFWSYFSDSTDAFIKLERRQTFREPDDPSWRALDEVADIMGVGRSTVLDWSRKYREGGLAALSTKFASGRPTVLSDEQMLELRTLLIGSDPRQFSLGLALWTRSLVGELIKQRFKKTLSDVTVGRILKKLGMSPQRPLYRAYQQDPKKVQVWKQETYPRIRAEAAECGGVVLFADEASVRTDYHAGTTWGAI